MQKRERYEEEEKIKRRDQSEIMQSVFLLRDNDYIKINQNKSSQIKIVETTKQTAK